MHLFLSPHLDDAVLSCGGTIHQLVAQGESVTVLTTMTGDPPYDLPETPITADLHQRWQAGDQPGKARRQEDREALATLGAKYIHIPIQDCVYRVIRKEGNVIALYPTEESLWGAVHPEDYAMKVLRGIRQPRATTIYVPLGVGGHVDHRIVRDWGLWLDNGNPVFYEEYPYINAKIEVDRALAHFSPRHMQLEIHELSDASVTAKTRAIACYASQISTFWSDIADMEKQTRQSMLEAGGGTPAERFWRIVK